MIRVKSTLVGCAYTLLKAPRGPFYRHKGPRSRWNPIWKAILSFFLSGGAPDSPVHTGHCPVPDFFPSMAKPTVGSLGAVGALDTVRCTPDSPVPHPTVGTCHASPVDFAADSWHWRPLAHRTVRCTTGQSGEL